MDTETKQENEVLLQELLKHAQKADEPGAQDNVVTKGDDSTPPMVVTSIRSAGYTYIYDTLTGERSLTNNNMLPMQLKKRRPDGSMVFTTIKPRVMPTPGVKYKCLLHPSDPNRAYYDTLGLPVCRKDNLTSPFQVKRHMQKRHKMEWEALEDAKKEAENKRSRDMQEALILAVGNKIVTNEPVSIASAISEPELYISDKPAKPKKKRGRPKKL